MQPRIVTIILVIALVHYLRHALRPLVPAHPKVRHVVVAFDRPDYTSAVGGEVAQVLRLEHVLYELAAVA